MQFGAKPLFENISAKFGNGNRYGLIGANGCGKSTFMKILSGELTPTSGNVSFSPNDTVGTLSQELSLGLFASIILRNYLIKVSKTKDELSRFGNR